MIAVHCGCSGVNGTLSDSFEYFYKLWELNKDTKLIFTGFKPDLNFFKQKYIIDENCFNNFLYIDYNQLKNLQKTHIKKLLSFAHYLYNYKIDLDCEVHLILNDFNKLNNAYCYGEYDSIMGLSNYTYKIYFDIHRIYKHENNTYIKCLKDTLFSLKIKQKYHNIILQKQVYNRGDIFKLIDNFVYIKTPSSFDKHPRMFAEAYYQNINIDYYNENNSKDGSYYRYQDILDNSIYKRTLDDKDIIIERMLS